MTQPLERLDLFRRLTNLIHSSLRLEEVMNQIVAEVTALFAVDACALYLREDGSGDLVLAAQRGYAPEAVGVTRLKVGEGFTGWAAARREVVTAPRARDDPRYAFRPEIGEAEYTSILSLPIVRDETTVGVLTLQTREERTFDESEVELARAVAEQVYSAIENARLYRNLEERLEEVTRLYEVVRSIGTTLNLREVLDEILQHAVRILGGRGGTLRILGEDGLLRLRASHHLPAEMDPDASALAVGEGVSGKVAATGRPLRVEVEGGRGPAPIRYRNLLVVPMLYGGKVIGTLGVFDKHDAAGRAAAFAEADERILTILGQRAAEAIIHADLFGRVESLLETYRRRVQELEILNQISRALQTSQSREEALFVILTGVTSGKGLGYNRALALLVEEDGRALRGAMGIGPTVEDVGRVWEELPRRFETLEDYFESVDLATIVRSPFNLTVRGIRLPLVENAPLPARAVLERRAFNCRDVASGEVDRGFVGTLRTNAFAVVPIWAKDIVIGALVVDNCFNRRAIEDEELQLLETFAHQAGLALSSVRLLEEVQGAMRRLEQTTQQLVEAKRLAAIGEVAAGVAHDIRNPLTAIGGFTRRIGKLLPEDHKARRYVEIVLSEVGRLERLARDVLDLARDRIASPEEVDLKRIVEEWRRARGAVGDEGEVRIRYAGDAWLARGDRVLLEQAIWNVLQNALDAAGPSGEIEVTARRENGDHVVEIRDAGGGMEPEVVERAFDAFFTTKTEGTGLGLSLVRKALRAHGGEAEVASTGPEGTCVRLRWPGAPPKG